jgi:hypothetical protein
MDGEYVSVHIRTEEKPCFPRTCQRFHKSQWQIVAVSDTSPESNRMPKNNSHLPKAIKLSTSKVRKRP